MSKPWWEVELPEIERELRSYLFRQLPTRQDKHDDLVNETLLSISEWLRGHDEGFLSSMKNPTIEDERRALSAFSKIVLKRRIADQFRLDAREWGHRLAIEDKWLSSVAEDAPSVEHGILIRRMLQITIGVLAKMKREDRDLIAFATSTKGVTRALTPRERQRLKRARSRIAEAIITEIGTSVVNLLRTDE